MIHARVEILTEHRDAETGDIDYSSNGVAGENENIHDHWLESTGKKIMKNYSEAQGDTLVFECHTLQPDEIEYVNVGGRRSKTDTVLNFISQQGDGGGAHDEDEVGQVIILDNELERDDITVSAGVFYGLYEPNSEYG